LRSTSSLAPSGLARSSAIRGLRWPGGRGDSPLCGERDNGAPGRLFCRLPVPQRLSASFLLPLLVPTQVLRFSASQVPLRTQRVLYLQSITSYTPIFRTIFGHGGPKSAIVNRFTQISPVFVCHGPSIE
jgi:hypothetical protein